MRTDRYLDWQHSGNGQGVYGAIFAAMFLSFAQVSFVGIGAGAIAGFVIGKLIGLALMSSAGRVAQIVYAPTAAGSYTRTHSNIDALEAKGDFTGAVAAWEAVALAQPDNPWPLIRAGELYLRDLGQPELALDRFRHATSLPGITPEQDRYASQKVIDLHLGPLHDEGRAMVEMRRLIERHAGTREADGARVAIQRLKAQRGDPG